MQTVRPVFKLIACGLIGLCFFLLLAIASQVFPGLRVAIVALLILGGAIGIPTAIATENKITAIVIGVCCVIGTISGLL
jgi:hypothetical protein